MNELNIIICGVGGQGNVLLEKIIGYSAMKEGYLVRAADIYGASQRGGSVQSFLRIGSEISSSMIAAGKCHIVLGLEPREALYTAAKFLIKDGLVIVNTNAILPTKVKLGEMSYPPIETILSLIGDLTQNIISLDANTLARQTTGNEKSVNIIILGVLIGAGALPLNHDSIREVIKQRTGNFAPSNIKAFEAGFDIGQIRKTPLTLAQLNIS